MKKPIRIQRKRIKGWKLPENTVYVGRPTKWGNPYRVGKLWDNKYPVHQEQAVGLYKKYAAPSLTETQLKELKGKNLCCWCSLNEKCHADILLELANS